MTYRLHRYYGNGHLHFITCSCHRRHPWLGSARRRNRFLKVLEEVRQRYRFVVVGYVVMPEHFHLLISEPETGTPSTVMQVLKQRFGHQVLKQLRRRRGSSQSRLWEKEAAHVWQRRFYDFNVWTREKRIDTKTSSWVKTPSDIRKLGGTLFCDRRYDTVFVYHNGAKSYYAARAFRGSLRV